MRETIQNANGKQFHAVSLSGGKDSTAMLLLMIERDMPINTGVGIERILRGFARRNDRDRRVFAADRAGRAHGVRFAARSLADLADTEMVAAAFSCEKGEFMSREPFEAMPDVMDAKQLAEALQISKVGAYNLLSSPDFPTLRIGGRKLVMKNELVEWLKSRTNRTP